MTRKLISAVLVLVLCISLALTVSAESKAIDFVVDEYDIFTADELTALNEAAAGVYQRTGVGVFFVFTQEEILEEYDVDLLTGGMTDYVIMLENDTSWFTFYGGKGTEIDLEKEEELRGIYDATETYGEGVAAFLDATEACFPANVTIVAPAGEWFVYDDADLLTDAEEDTLSRKLAEVSHTYQAEIVICTVASVDGGDVDVFLEYVYDSMGFGYGENHDGVLLLLCMDTRDYRILSNGFAAEAINPGDIENIGDEIVPHLSDGAYAAGFDAFADQCAYYLDGYINGFPFDFGSQALISLVLGFLVGWIVSAVLKGQLKSVRKQDRANSYLKPGSLQLTVSNDFFLYRNVTQSRKESQSSSSGSSSSSRSTGGGKF